MKIVSRAAGSSVYNIGLMRCAIYGPAAAAAAAAHTARLMSIALVYIYNCAPVSHICMYIGDD